MEDSLNNLLTFLLLPTVCIDETFFTIFDDV